MSIQAEILEVMRANANTAEQSMKLLEGAAPLITLEQATAVAMVFVQREAQKASVRKDNAVLLGVATQLLAATLSNNAPGTFTDGQAVEQAQSLIQAVERLDG